MPLSFMSMVGIAFVAGVIVCLALISIYNALVILRNRFRNAYAQIDVQLRRRYDLIPNLVETAKGYLAHERQTLEAVTLARNQAAAAEARAAQAPGDAGLMKSLNGAEAMLTGALGRLLAVAEAYPDLKANAQMRQLVEEITSTENRIAFARQAYNDAVMEYNTARETFPNNIVSPMLGFASAELFAVAGEAEKAAPKVSFT